jgi:thiamine biosynthesis lipoprotein
MPLSKLSNKQRTNSPKQNHNVLNFEAIGTRWDIIIRDSASMDVLSKIFDSVKERIDEFDLNYSRFRDDSFITKIFSHTGSYQLPDDAKPLFDLYQQLYDLTEGLVTPLVGQLLSDAGYNKDYTLRPGKLHAVPTWQQAIEYRFPEITIKKRVLIDVGAAGKGYLIDIIGDLIKENGINNFLINAGGDIVQSSLSNTPDKIALEHPDKLDEAIGIASISNGSLCGSAINRRRWGDFNHMINPVIKKSPKHILATWVIADSALVADGLSTALFFTTPKKLNSKFDFEYALINSDLSLEHSDNFPAEFFNEIDEAT